VETQYGRSYVTIHYGGVSQAGGSAGMDIEFTPADANVYFNGALFVTVPGAC
jgi:hypothetical protein